jgi:peptidoglycan/LPS O-acetylase OafA/YrhL
LLAAAHEPSPQQGAFRLGYRPVLDGVRAVAILSVLAIHFRGDNTSFPTRGGFLGVDIFFVLSGFLITSILLDEYARRGSISFRAFYVRRALRLFPALFLVVALFVLYAVTIGPDSNAQDNLIAAGATLTYWTNWLYGEQLFSISETGLTHAWSLSIEEQFYLLWPVILVGALALWRRRGALAVALGIVTAVPLLRLVEWDGETSTMVRMYQALDTRADSLLIGCTLAILLTNNAWLRGTRSLVLRFALVPAVLVVVLSLMLAYEFRPWVFLGGYTLFALATAVVLYNLVTWRPPVLAPLLELRPMVYIGRISYGLYLWHFPIYIILRSEVESGLIVALVGLLLTFAVAALSYRYVEQPFLRLKKRFDAPTRPSPVRPPRPAAASPATSAS